MTTTPLKAADIRAALRRYYAGSQFALAFEVARGTGFNVRRHLDAVAMDLWPSRGLALHGIEIKVSRGDWRRELKQPDKAEEIAAYCDFFWIAAPKDLVPIAEMPMAWGLMECDGGRIAVRQQAKQTPAKDVNRLFLAAMLRGATRGIDPDEADSLLAARRAELEADFASRVEASAERRRSEDRDDAEAWRKFRDQLGLDKWDALLKSEELLLAAKFVLASGALKAYSGLHLLQQQLAKASADIESAVQAAGIAPLLAENATRDPYRKKASRGR